MGVVKGVVMGMAKEVVAIPVPVSLGVSVLVAVAGGCCQRACSWVWSKERAHGCGQGSGSDSGMGSTRGTVSDSGIGSEKKQVRIGLLLSDTKCISYMSFFTYKTVFSRDVIKI